MKKTATLPAALGGLTLSDYLPIPEISDETTAFSATVYDTKTRTTLGTLLNEGRGGCHLFRPDSSEGYARWAEACRDFTPVPWAGGKHDGGGEWGLADALALLSETALSLMSECGEGETKFMAADLRTVVGNSSLPVLTVETKPGDKSGAGMWRLADECHDEYGTLVFGMPSTSKSGGVNVFATEAVDVDGERSSLRAGDESNAC